MNKVFQQLFAMRRCPEDATDAELGGMACKFNWIPAKATIEADYAVALRLVYTAFCASREKA